MNQAAGNNTGLFSGFVGEQFFVQSPNAEIEGSAGIMISAECQRSLQSMEAVGSTPSLLAVCVGVLFSP